MEWWRKGANGGSEPTGVSEASAVAIALAVLAGGLLGGVAGSDELHDVREILHGRNPGEAFDVLHCWRVSVCLSDSAAKRGRRLAPVILRTGRAKGNYAGGRDCFAAILSRTF